MFIGKIRQDKIHALNLSHSIFRECILFVISDGISDINLINNEQPTIHGRESRASIVGRTYRGIATTDGLTYDNTTGDIFNSLGYTIGSGVIKTDTQSFGHIMSVRHSTAAIARLSLQSTDNTIRIHSGSDLLTTSLPITENQYTTVILTKEEPSNDYVIYRNGDIFQTGNTSGVQGNLEHINIGRIEDTADGFPFPGNIAWVGVWKRPLTSHEVGLLENPWSLLKPAPPAGHFIPPAAVSAASLLLMQQSFRQ